MIVSANVVAIAAMGTSVSVDTNMPIAATAATMSVT